MEGVEVTARISTWGVGVPARKGTHSVGAVVPLMGSAATCSSACRSSEHGTRLEEVRRENSHRSQHDGIAVAEAPRGINVKTQKRKRNDLGIWTECMDVLAICKVNAHMQYSTWCVRGCTQAQPPFPKGPPSAPCGSPPPGDRDPSDRRAPAAPSAPALDLSLLSPPSSSGLDLRTPSNPASQPNPPSQAASSRPAANFQLPSPLSPRRRRTTLLSPR